MHLEPMENELKFFKCDNLRANVDPPANLDANIYETAAVQKL